MMPFSRETCSKVSSMIWSRITQRRRLLDVALRIQLGLLKYGRGPQQPFCLWMN